MTISNDEIYFRSRERASREMANKASDANVRAVHLQLAQLYAMRVDQQRDPADRG